MVAAGELTLSKRIKCLYPQPLAVSYRRLADVWEPSEVLVRQTRMMDLAEAIIRFCSCLAAGLQAAESKPDTEFERLLVDLERPSLDRCLAVLEQFSGALARRQSSTPERVTLARQLAECLETPSQPAGAIEIGVRRLEESLNVPVRERPGPIDFLRLLVAYRNAMLEQAVVLPASECTEHQSALLPALEELLARLAFLMEHPIGTVQKVQQTPEAHEHLVRVYEGLAVEPGTYLGPASLQRGQCHLFVRRDSQLVWLASLHPMVVAADCVRKGCSQEGLFLLSGVQGNVPQYMGYPCGHSSQMPLLSADVAEFFRRARDRRWERADDFLYYAEVCKQLADGALDAAGLARLEDLRRMLGLDEARAAQLLAGAQAELGPSDGSGSASPATLESYRELLKFMLRDGTMTALERNALEQKRQELSISEPRARSLEAEVLSAIATQRLEAGDTDTACRLVRRALRHDAQCAVALVLADRLDAQAPRSSSEGEHAAIDTYRTLVAMAYLDGNVTDEDRRILEKTREELRITADTARRIEELLRHSGETEEADPEKASLFGVVAVRQGFITKVQLLEALGEQAEATRLGNESRLGDVLVQKNWMTAPQVEQVLEIQRFFRERNEATRLGQIAVRMGYLREADVQRCLDLQERIYASTASAPRIGDLLVREGFLTTEQRGDVVRQLGVMTGAPAPPRRPASE